MDDGIETIEIDSLSSFVKHTLDERDESRLTVYRGHASSKWKLRPTLYREIHLAEMGEIERERCFGRARTLLQRADPDEGLFDKWQADGFSADVFRPNELAGIETYLATKARQIYLSSGRLLAPVAGNFANSVSLGIPGEDFAYLVQMRNLGAPMRWLDWTHNPLVALFFALDGTQTPQDLPTPAVFQLTTCLTDKQCEAHYIEGYGYLSAEVLGGESRARAQRPSYLIPSETWDLEGTFGDTSVSASRTSSLRRFTLQPDSLAKIRKSLGEIGVHEYSVYPDEAGLFRRISRAFFDD